MRYGLVYNPTDMLQQVGVCEIPPRAYGRVDASYVEWLRAHPTGALLPVDGVPERAIFIRTAHRPTNARYSG